MDTYLGTVRAVAATMVVGVPAGVIVILSWLCHKLRRMKKRTDLSQQLDRGEGGGIGEGMMVKIQTMRKDFKDKQNRAGRE